METLFFLHHSHRNMRTTLWNNSEPKAYKKKIPNNNGSANAHFIPITTK
jgi:hypothetical protein